ncbi:hypothetical protein XBP1_1380007 [Xenorhabdus bovienii str. puntauvense]|uniref:Arc-like DNA binding domain-containing protein n=1 Tax=Xenorhabdus bovienii str. puntauvense TaxID=1398201 RepID=A0A077NC93_XENBV|nr:hypothetical protein [Xenorhabdus bovienii]CDG95575.1 hypothetical protein XBP1_1380007 [Xenorhabdus bovienii str. puntauvense]
MIKESKTINPMQLRIPPEVEKGIIESAKRNLRTRHSEVVYRLMLLDAMERKGEIEI